MLINIVYILYRSTYMFGARLLSPVFLNWSIVLVGNHFPWPPEGCWGEARNRFASFGSGSEEPQWEGGGGGSSGGVSGGKKGVCGPNNIELIELWQLRVIGRLFDNFSSWGGDFRALRCLRAWWKGTGELRIHKWRRQQREWSKNNPKGVDNIGRYNR